MKQKLTTIIRDYEFSTIIGMLDVERTKAQKVRVNAEFTSSDFINYVDIINAIKQIYDEFKFESVEKSVEKVAQILKAKFTNLSSLNFEILKVEIIKNAKVGAKIEIIY